MKTNPISLAASQAKVKKNKGLPLVWLLPVVALFASSWLIYKSLMDKGPEITIQFTSADGLEADKTKIKFRNVDIGKVTAMSITEDLKGVQVTAELEPYTADYLNANTRFWVVRPRIGVSGVSGLGTLLSGPYIEVQPGDGPRREHFTGLTNPPVVEPDRDGRHYTLETGDLGGITPGTPIHYQGIVVGEVLNHELDSGGGAIRLWVFVNAPYHRFIRPKTRFWKDSGIDFTAGADGFKLRTGPLVSMLSGGITFSTPETAITGETSTENSVFHLYENFAQSKQIVYRHTLKYVMYFQGDVRGLSVGAPVLLLGIPVGKVASVQLEIDAKTEDIRIPVVVEVEPERVKQVNGQSDLSDAEVVKRLVAKGLRGQLQTGSLLTGQLLVEFDFHPGDPVYVKSESSTFPELPTVPGSLDQFADSARAALNKLAKLPLDKTIHEIDNTLLAVQRTLANADKTMGSAQQALVTLEPGSTARYEFEQTLQEFSQAARSIRSLADYLEQNPEALIAGK